MFKVQTFEGYRAIGVRCAFFRVFVILLASLINLLGASSFVIGQELGGLAIMPTAVVFEGRKRNAEITLVNTASTPMTYRISFKNMRMLENGTFEDIEEPQDGELFADQLIRFSPRQVYLEPGVSQVVRLQVRKPADLATGEYRSHLLFQSVPSATTGEDIEKVLLKEDEISVNISMIYGVTIPVLVRHGELTASLSITDLTLNPSGHTNKHMVLSFSVQRNGNKSVSGEADVRFESAQGGDKQLVGYVRGIAVLFPYPMRNVRIPLTLYEEAGELPKGTLQIIYRARPEDGGEVQATAELRIP